MSIGENRPGIQVLVRALVEREEDIGFNEEEQGRGTMGTMVGGNWESGKPLECKHRI